MAAQCSSNLCSLPLTDAIGCLMADTLAMAGYLAEYSHPIDSLRLETPKLFQLGS